MAAQAGAFPAARSIPVPPSRAQVLIIKASPTQSDTLFAIAGPNFVFGSTDFGQTWSQLTLPAGGIPSALAFSPADPHTLFLGQQHTEDVVAQREHPTTRSYRKRMTGPMSHILPVAGFEC
jgi:hypothetical protein